MKSDGISSLPIVPRSNSYQTIHKSAYQSPVLQITNDVAASHPSMDNQVCNEQAKLHFPNIETYRRWTLPSAVWRLILITGDTIILVSLLTLTLVLALPARGGVSFTSTAYNSGFESGKLVWGFLALLSWSLAAAITQAQSLSFATNRFKSSFSTLFALLLMSAFWIGCTELVIGTSLAMGVKVVLLFLGGAIPAFGVWRIIYAECMRLPQFRSRAVIVGINSASVTLVKELHRAKHPDLTILGYISEEENQCSQVENLPVLGNKRSLLHMVQQGMIDVIVMSLDYTMNRSLFQETIDAARAGVSIVPVSILYERISGKIAVEAIGDQWYGSLPAEPLVSPLYLCWQKVLDLTFGLLGTVVLLALLPFIALCIYIDSPGPIFYQQERVGYRGKTFHILKFRSMKIDAEKIGKAVWAAQGDMRVTRVGRLLRATHLDELPQVINILRGEMSLIGPRPERQVFVDQLAKAIPFYRCRLSVLPGLTGWAQVKYPYASSDYDALMKLQYDLYYIKHRSFIFDSFIVLQTVIEVLLCHGR